MSKLRMSAVVCATAAIAAAATPARAMADDSFSCRASAARLTLPQGLGDIEPVRANAPITPCSTQGASVVAPTALGPLAADAVSAGTARVGNGPGTAAASASHAGLTLPGLTVTATAAEATATSACNGTTPSNSGTSRVAGLVINGTPIVLPPGDEFHEIPLGPLGSVAVNREIVDGTTLTRRAIDITTPLVSVVVAEAIVGHGAGACTAPAPGGGGGGGGGSGTGGGGSAGPAVCPPGATYDASRNLCVIREGGGSAGVIVVGRPFEGPSGGTVMSLAEARKRYKSVCLRGSGSKYAIVGSNKADRITGTNRRDRILLLAGRDKAEGGRGDDCIDGGRGGDTMSGALGADRIIGGRGNDHLVGGSHADTLSAGSGNDTINTGFGKDRVSGGSGSDRINMATAGPAAARISCGRGRDKIRVNGNEARRARGRKAGCERVYVIR